MKKVNPKIANEIKERLVVLHDYWHSHDQDSHQFNYKYISYKDSKLLSKIDRYSNLSTAFEFSGINPYCHLRGTMYGDPKNVDFQKKKLFMLLLQMAKEVGGAENLNDNTINTQQILSITPNFYDNKSHEVCDEAKCKLLTTTYQNVYAKGIRFFGSWKNTLQAVGFNYNDISRKKGKYPRAMVMKDVLELLKDEQFKWNITKLRKDHLSIYKGIHNSHPDSPFKFTNRSVMEVAYLELRYLLKKESNPDLTVEEFYKAL